MGVEVGLVGWVGPVGQDAAVEAGVQGHHPVAEHGRRPGVVGGVGGGQAGCSQGPGRAPAGDQRPAQPVEPSGEVDQPGAVGDRDQRPPDRAVVAGGVQLSGRVGPVTASGWGWRVTVSGGSLGGGSLGASQATVSAMSRPASVGLEPTRAPARSSASILAAAVPRPPETMAPAWPIFLPGGAVTPAT